MSSVKSFRIKSRRNSGFTLIELIVVIAILAILAAILIPAVAGFIQKSRKQAAVSDACIVYSAINAYMADEDKWQPTNLSSIQFSLSASLSAVPNHSNTVTSEDIHAYMGEPGNSALSQEIPNPTTQVVFQNGNCASVTVIKNGVTATYSTIPNASAAA